MDKIRLISVFMVLVFSPCYLVGDQQKLMEEISPGHAFIGGNPPKIVGVKKVKTIYKNQKPYHLYQVVFRRASYDKGGGWFPLMEAKTWGDLFTLKKVEKDFIVLKWLREKNVHAKWNEKFPPLKCRIKYTLAFDRGKGWQINRQWVKQGKGRVAKPANRYPHHSSPQKLIIEHLVRGLPPGSHKIELRAIGQTDQNHPLVQGKNILDWIKYFVLSKFETLLTTVGKKYYTITISTYRLNVPAQVPMVEGKSINQSREIIRNHYLTPFDDPEYTADKSKHGMVRLQDPIAGTLLKEGDRVGLTYYQYSKNLDPEGDLDPISGTWKWTATCGTAKFSGSFSITLQGDGIKITGNFSDGHDGSLEGTFTGSGITFTRTFHRGTQAWTGNLKGQKITGTVTDKTHTKLKISTTCTFTANR